MILQFGILMLRFSRNHSMVEEALYGAPASLETIRFVVWWSCMHPDFLLLQSDVRHAYLQALLHGPPVYIGRKPAMRFSERVRPTADTFGSPANNESTEIYFFHGCDHTTTHWAVNRVEAIAGIESSMKPSAFIRTAAASKIFSYSCGHGRLQWPPDT